MLAAPKKGQRWDNYTVPKIKFIISQKKELRDLSPNSYILMIGPNKDEISLVDCQSDFYYTVLKIKLMNSQKKELRGLSPNSYIPRICLHIWLQQNRQTDPGNI